jgi:hypothetical protein
VESENDSLAAGLILVKHSRGYKYNRLYFSVTTFRANNRTHIHGHIPTRSPELVAESEDLSLAAGLVLVKRSRGYKHDNA